MSSLCQRKNSVLVVIDIQSGFTKIMPAKVMARLQRQTGLLIQAANKLAIPILVTEQYPRGLGHTEPVLKDLLNADAHIFEKTVFSSVRAEGFLEHLQSLKRSELILTGMEAHVCVMQTALDLLKQQYTVMAVTDAISSRSRDNYENALNRMQQAGVTITNAESVLFEWMEDAKDPAFKEIQALLK